jgi:predicted outer membrane repeat protein
MALLDAEEYKITINANKFLNDTAYHGGGFYERTSWNIHISNNVFIENETFRGGAIGLYHPATQDNLSSRDYFPIIINNTFWNNSATSDGGAIRFQGDINAPQVYNCIFWENTAPAGPDIRNWSALPVVVSYSDIDTYYINGAWTGDQNIFTDPLFTNPICHLTASSPCRDVGLQSFQTPPLDYEGEPRPDPVGGVDIGADEFYDDPEAPEALYPDDIGIDYFVAKWTNSLWSVGYRLDVAYDEDFQEMVPGYDNRDTGKDTFAIVSGLMPDVYFFRVRGYNAQWTSENSNEIMVLGVGIEAPAVQSSKFKVQSYPNPAKGIVNCQLSIVSCQRVALKLYDLHGREVAEVLDAFMPAGEHFVQFDVSGLPGGIYILRMIVDCQMSNVNLKLVVQ